MPLEYVEVDQVSDTVRPETVTTGALPAPVVTERAADAPVPLAIQAA